MQYMTYSHTDTIGYLAEALKKLTSWYGDDHGAILSAVAEEAERIADQGYESGLYGTLWGTMPMRWLDAAYDATGVDDATQDDEDDEALFIEALRLGAKEMLHLA